MDVRDVSRYRPVMRSKRCCGFSTQVLNLLGGVSIPYPPIPVPLEGSSQATPVRLDCTNVSVNFESQNGTIILVRKRYLDERPNTACYMRGVFSKLSNFGACSTS